MLYLSRAGPGGNTSQRLVNAFIRSMNYGDGVAASGAVRIGRYVT